MSGRIRSLKPEWLEDEPLVACSSDARVLSAALLLLADDYGNGRAGELYLASRVFPGQSPETLRKALEELTRMRYVVLYEVDGQRYFHVRNWAKHQRVQHPGKPIVPQYEASTETVKKDSGEPPESLAPDRDRRPGPTTDDRRGGSDAREPEDRFLESLTTPDDEIPDPFIPSQDNIELAVRFRLDEPEERAMYVAHRKRERYRCGNWPADYELWLRRSAKMARERGAKRGGGPDPDWPTDDALRFREAIRAGREGKSLQAKERAGNLDYATALRLSRERSAEIAERAAERRPPSSRPPGLASGVPAGSLAALTAGIGNGGRS